MALGERRAVDHVHRVAARRERIEQLGDLLGRVLQIVVHGDHDGAGGRPDAAQQGVVLTVVAHQVDAAHARLARRQLQDDLPARVAAAVVDQHDLGARRAAGQHRSQPGDQLGQRRGAVVHRYDHGDLQRRSRRRRWPGFVARQRRAGRGRRGHGRSILSRLLWRAAG
jgi:hypothetical protein